MGKVREATISSGTLGSGMQTAISRVTCCVSQISAKLFKYSFLFYSILCLCFSVQYMYCVVCFFNLNRVLFLLLTVISVF